MSIEEFKQYFETLAAAHQDVLHTPQEPHFCMWTIDEILTKQELNLSGVAIMLEYPSGFLSDSHSDNIFDNFIAAFYVLKQFEDGNHAQFLTRNSECFSIGRDIISKLLKDYADFDTRPIPWLNTNSPKWDQAGTIFGSWTGYRFTVEIGDPSMDVQYYDESKWDFSSGSSSS